MRDAGIDFWDPQTAVDNDGAPMLNGSGPTFSANPWDLVILNGKGIPGICKIHGLPTLAVDKKKPQGVDGIVVTVTGYQPGPIEIETVLWTQAQWNKFQENLPYWWTKPHKRQEVSNKANPKHKDQLPLARTIVHPATSLYGISLVVVLGMSIPEPGPIPQSRLIKFKCQEWTPLGLKSVTQTAGAVRISEDNRQPASAALGGDPPSVTDLGPDGPGRSPLP
jgi:hypothetical protein